MCRNPSKIFITVINNAPKDIKENNIIYKQLSKDISHNCNFRISERTIKTIVYNVLIPSKNIKNKN